MLIGQHTLSPCCLPLLRLFTGDRTEGVCPGNGRGPGAVPEEAVKSVMQK